MSKKIKTFIIGIYLALCVGISGNYYINPKITYDFVKITKVNSYGDFKEYKTFFDIEIDKKKLLKNKHIKISKENISYNKFKYSLLYSIIGFIVLISFLQLFPKK